MSNKPPTRFDDAYTKIDKFRKYEFTHCITYELARRNSNVANILYFLTDLFSLYHDHILPTLTNYKNATLTDDILSIVSGTKPYYGSLTDLVNRYDKTQFSNYFENLTFDNMEEKISHLVQILTQELHDNYYMIYQYEPGKFTRNLDNIYDPSIYLERDKALSKHVQDITSSEIDKEYYYNYYHNTNQYFTIYQDIHEDEKEFSFSTIYPNFNTPMINFTETKVELNLHLPEDEIIDYIKKIKSTYHERNSIIKTPKQLLEEELEIYDNDTGIIETEKWADILFIYDYYHAHQQYTEEKNYKILQKLQIELTKYHGVKIKKHPGERKNKKDNSYKKISWEQYLKENPDTNEENIYFDSDSGEKAYLSTKTIIHKFELIKGYIQGENPKYKTLIHKSI